MKYLRMNTMNQRGSALVLVLMITLVLSAFGLIAMRDIAMGVHQSASFRIRAQASTLSESAAAAFAMRSGNKANAYLNALQISNMGKDTLSGSAIFGGSDSTKYYPGSAPANAAAFRKDLAMHGGFVVFDNEQLAATKGLVPNQAPVSGIQKNETGLFRGPSDQSSFEVQNKSDFRVILRDLKEGIPAPGYSESFCFKKATIGARSTIGDLPSLTEPTQYGVGMNTNEVLIGPVECGYN